MCQLKKNELTKVYEVIRKHEKTFTLNGIENKVLESSKYARFAKDVIKALTENNNVPI